MLARPTAWDYAGLLVLSLIWGSSFLFIEIAIRDFPPFTLAAFRIVLSAILLWIVAWRSGHRIPRDPTIWKAFVVIGLTAMVIPFSSVGWAQQELNSSTAAIAMAFTPLLTIAFAHLMTEDERLSGRRAIGAMIGLIGVFVLFGGPDLFGAGGSNEGPPAIRLFAMFLGPLGYAFSSVLLKRHPRLPPIISTLLMMITASVIIVPLALIFEAPNVADFQTSSILAATYLGLASSAIGGALMIRLINRAGVTFMALNNYLVPLVGVLWGTVLLSEQIANSTLVAFLLIMSGVAAASSGRQKAHVDKSSLGDK